MNKSQFQQMVNEIRQHMKAGEIPEEVATRFQQAMIDAMEKQAELERRIVRLEKHCEQG